MQGLWNGIFQNVKQRWHSEQFHAENNLDSLAEEEIKEKGTERPEKKELLVKIIQIHMAFQICWWKNFKKDLFKVGSIKKCQQKEILRSVLPTKIIFSPNEVFDTYVEFLEDLHIDTNTSNILI